MAHAPLPASAISRSSAWTSGASGVVCDASRRSPPMRYPTVPSNPQRMPAASKTDAIRYAVVVLPLVPVIPTTASSWLGWRKNAAAATASASRASSTDVHGTGTPGGAASSEITASAPRSMAWRANVAPSARSPFMATNTCPGTTRRES